MTTLEASPALTGPIPALPSSIQAGRAALAAATRDYRAIPDEVLERPWNWGEHANPDGVRYGIYRGAETLEAAAAEIERAVAGAPVRPPGPAGSPGRPPRLDPRQGREGRRVDRAPDARPHDRRPAQLRLVLALVGLAASGCRSPGAGHSRGRGCLGAGAPR